MNPLLVGLVLLVNIIGNIFLPSCSTFWYSLRAEKFPKLDGIDPLISLLLISMYNRLTFLSKSGRGPVNLFCLRRTLLRVVHLPTSRGILPRSRLIPIFRTLKVSSKTKIWWQVASEPIVYKVQLHQTAVNSHALRKFTTKAIIIHKQMLETSNLPYLKRNFATQVQGRVTRRVSPIHLECFYQADWNTNATQSKTHSYLFQKVFYQTNDSRKGEELKAR
ncbi:unnamed protein product [Vicia faba]|uniref:Uncharacterized protein n=1 Tax=Vicia faba TaxID=3906 RepID=A0AAV1ADK2_VICFA|nr:unnamed protein product [Vicia faba]